MPNQRWTLWPFTHKITKNKQTNIIKKKLKEKRRKERRFSAVWFSSCCITTTHFIFLVHCSYQQKYLNGWDLHCSVCSGNPNWNDLLSREREVWNLESVGGLDHPLIHYLISRWQCRNSYKITHLYNVYYLNNGRVKRIIHKDANT
jgi:hypothetical protein